jgi:linoleoyl-CoA desaturase
MAERIRFVDEVNKEATLKKRVDDYFSTNKISPKANGFMIFKTTVYLIMFIGLYALILLNNYNMLTTMILFGFLGLAIAFVGINICHDAIHGAYSNKKWVNKVMSMPFNIVGASEYMWSIMHNIVHHTYTNIDGHDEDIELVPILRFTPCQPFKKIMRFQHIYAFFLYSLSTLSWVFIKDYRKFFQQQIGHYDNSSHHKREYFLLFFYKLIYYVLFIVLPFIFIQLAWWKILIGFIILHMVEGLTLAVIFVLAHVVEGPEFPKPDEKGIIEHNWAAHQLRTTSDFCRHNNFVSFFCGGLNFQVEHHLFPRVCHVHYQAISEIVKNCALEFNIPYNEHPRFWGAVASHIRLLKQLGKEDA